MYFTCFTKSYKGSVYRQAFIICGSSILGTLADKENFAYSNQWLLDLEALLRLTKAAPLQASEIVLQAKKSLPDYLQNRKSCLYAFKGILKPWEATFFACRAVATGRCARPLWASETLHRWEGLSSHHLWRVQVSLFCGFRSASGCWNLLVPNLWLMWAVIVLRCT